MKQLTKALLLILIMITGISLLAGLAAGEVRLVKGQTLYLPLSTSYMAKEYSFNLRATVFIYNTDPAHSINLVKMHFYNTSGKLIESYLPQPLKIDPSAGTYINVKKALTGEEGAVAHFEIQWQAETNVNEPIVRGMMLGAAGNRGYTFETQPRIIQEIAD